MSFCGPPVQVNAKVELVQSEEVREPSAQDRSGCRGGCRNHAIGGEIGCCLAGRREFHSDVARSQTDSCGRYSHQNMDHSQEIKGVRLDPRHACECSGQSAGKEKRRRYSEHRFVTEAIISGGRYFNAKRDPSSIPRWHRVALLISVRLGFIRVHTP